MNKQSNSVRVDELIPLLGDQRQPAGTAQGSGCRIVVSGDPEAGEESCWEVQIRKEFDPAPREVRGKGN